MVALKESWAHKELKQMRRHSKAHVRASLKEANKKFKDPPTKQITLEEVK